MKELFRKFGSKKIICILCSSLFLLALILFLFFKSEFMSKAEASTEETTTEETTTEETTTILETTTIQETTTEETTTIPPEPLPVTLEEYGSISEGSLYGKLTCPSIGLDCYVYMGDSNSILRKGAGQIPATYLPGQGELIMVGAHNNSYFNCLQHIQGNEIITLQTSYGVYQYQVVSTEVVDITGMNAYDFFTDHEQLLLYTCYPFDMLSHTDYRFMVHADYISGPSMVE